MRWMTLAACTAAMLGIVTTSAQAAPFANGSFETPDISGAHVTIPSGSTIGPWQVAGVDVDLINTTWKAADGGQNVDVNGHGPGSLCQTFDTEATRIYDVAFQLSRNGTAGVSSARLNVSVDGTLAGSFVHNAAGWTTANPRWQPHGITFTAAGAATTLCFQSATTGLYGPALDAVVVTKRNLPPTAAIASPVDGAGYHVGLDVTADYSCADPDGTISSCVGPVADGAAIDTASAGVKTFTVTATDNDGATGTATVSYNVRAVAGLCRATPLQVLDLRPGTSNAPTTPCADDADTVFGIQQGLVGAGLPEGLTIEDAATNAAAAKVANVTIKTLGLTIKVDALYSRASARLTSCSSAVLDRASQITSLTINGRPVHVSDQPLSIPLVIGALHLNQQARSGGTIAQRALFLDPPGTALDVTLGESVAGVVCGAS